MLIVREKESKKGIAEKYAKLMGKPFRNVDNSNAGILKVQEEASSGN